MVAFAEEAGDAAGPAPLTRTDEKADLETSGDLGSRINKTRSEVQVNWDKMLTYADGSSKLIGLKVTTERDGKTFEITGKEGRIGDQEATIEVDGNVYVKVSDGLEVHAEHATLYQSGRHYARAGDVSSLRGHDERLRRRLCLRQQPGHPHDSGRGRGSRDRRRQGQRRDGRGDRRTGIPPARTDLELQRRDESSREREMIEADGGVAHLTEDQDHLEGMQLRGHSTITTAGVSAGGLQALSGRDVDRK